MKRGVDSEKASEGEEGKGCDGTTWIENGGEEGGPSRVESTGIETG